MRAPGRLLGDEVMMRRAARAVALQTAVLAFASMLALVATVTVVVVRGEQNAADALLRGSVVTADDVGDPPPGAWLILARGQQVRSSPGLPAELTLPLAELRRTASPRVRLSNIGGEDRRDFRVATAVHDGGTVQVVLSLGPQHAQRTRLYEAMLGASILGLLLAGLLGLLVARRAVRPLAQALGLQRTFIADASHELRTPLTLLSTRAQVLAADLDRNALPDQSKQDAWGVVEDVRGLADVVDELLLAADPLNDETHELMDLGHLVAGVVETATAHATAARVTLSAPPCAQATVSGSARALRRALLSLIDNAIDHTPVGGRVTITVTNSKRNVIVAVSDTGPGVSPANTSSILRRFHSGGQRAGRAHYGLGLALTHDVANRHGGQLRLAPSELGATFELVLPAADGDSQGSPRN